MSLSQIVAHGLSLMEGNESNNFSDVFSDLLHSQSYVPSVDIIDKGTEINIYLNVPGVKPETIDVNFYNNIVNVKAQRVRPYINTECSIFKNEIIYGIFERNIGIPISVTNRDSVRISLSDGVLFICIDKSIEERNRFSVRLNASGVQTTGNATITINSNTSSTSSSLPSTPTRVTSEPPIPPAAPSKHRSTRRRRAQEYMQDSTQDYTQDSTQSLEDDREQIVPCRLKMGVGSDSE